ncbi:glycosyl hydrolase family 65 protein [Diplocloster agilis]|uniref:glycosyl hydrolase family 65 protein n=1 Tax=Diplocloster agilis TaxID=2850323 RepID=UPI000822E311|nr:glycosyl hydrolase family 65 protein [Suonthocola fibrivorans]MCU6733304.1 glycoside hydrolase family 65 protein [Suonthocola fibrivorans]SCI86454.1 Kojibiose phosphorylase [uncultured Clostridium sp.]
MMVLKRKGKWSPEKNKYYEGAWAQGNGYIQMRASFEEDLSGASQDEHYWRLPANVTLEEARNPVSKWGVYVPGIYGKHPILGEEIVNLPYPMGIQLYQDEERFDMGLSDYSDFAESLNLKNGVLARHFVWNTAAGSLEAEYTRYASLQNQHYIIQRAELTAGQDMEIRVESFVDAAVTTNGYSHFTDTKLFHQEGLWAEITLDSGQMVCMKCFCKFEDGDYYKEESSRTEQRLREIWKLRLKKGEPFVFYKYTIIATSLDWKDEADGMILSGPFGDLLRLRERMVTLELDAQRLTLKAHEEIWAKRWSESDVQIVGDKRLQDSLRFSIYHLLRAFPWSSQAAIDAKGFAGEAYFGHYFWDTEIYLLPFYLYTAPQKARSLIEFRYRMLEGAKKNAARYGYPGARYPWECCQSGLEQCSNWQYGDMEVHVTADVIYGLWHYCKATGDTEFLLNQGLEMMVETARYWCGRVDWAGDTCHLLGVMGPDEYLAFTNDNAYTNYMVKFALKQTLETLKIAGDERKNELGVTDLEMEEFQKVHDRLVFPYDEDAHFIWQCQDFDHFADVEFDKVWKDRSKPFGHFISQEKNYRSKALKQADTLGLFSLFPDAFDQETKKNCLEYYEKITTHDSSLSYVIHALVHAGVKDAKRSYEFLQKSMEIDLAQRGAAEGIHIANAGGLWQAVVCGLAGFSGIGKDGQPVFHPALPEHIRAIRFGLRLNGGRYQAEVTADQVTVTKEVG